MEVLMIHDLRAEYFDLPLDRYRLSFDDGLFSHYYYLPLLTPHPRPLQFFITTSLIQEAPARARFAGRHLTHRTTADYSRRAFIEGRREDFMTTEELRYLADQPGVRIGAHSHFHDVTLTPIAAKKPRPVSAWRQERFAHVPATLRRGLSIRSRLAFAGCEFRAGRLEARSDAEWHDFIRRDTELSLEWFRRHLGLTPAAYCFPFNEYSAPLLAILRSYGFREFYAGSAPKDPSLIPRTDIESLGLPPAGEAPASSGGRPAKRTE
jgi:peptidoglycan/xylan/chitin deacetylase (PgdA/CDA1 family)